MIKEPSTTHTNIALTSESWTHRYKVNTIFIGLYYAFFST